MSTNKKHSLIFDYWKTKHILKDGKVVDCCNSSCKSCTYKNCIPVVNDWGEPCCWACDKPVLIGDKYNEYYEKFKLGTDEENIHSMWDTKEVKSRIQRCHIIAESLNGTEDVSNLFLMCKNCHAESPDTTNYDAFIRWVYNRRERYSFGVDMKSLISGVVLEVTQRGLSFEDIAKNINFDYEEFSEYVLKNSTIHLDSNNKGLGAYTPISTEIVVMADFLIYKYNEMVNKGTSNISDDNNKTDIKNNKTNKKVKIYSLEGFY